MSRHNKKRRESMVSDLNDESFLTALHQEAAAQNSRRNESITIGTGQLRTATTNEPCNRLAATQMLSLSPSFTDSTFSLSSSYSIISLNEPKPMGGPLLPSDRTRTLDIIEEVLSLLREEGDLFMNE